MHCMLIIFLGLVDGQDSVEETALRELRVAVTFLRCLMRNQCDLLGRNFVGKFVRATPILACDPGLANTSLSLAVVEVRLRSCYLVFLFKTHRST